MSYKKLRSNPQFFWVIRIIFLTLFSWYRQSLDPLFSTKQVSQILKRRLEKLMDKLFSVASMLAEKEISKASQLQYR